MIFTEVDVSQVWLITGSSRGLGRAMAEAVLANGHRLVATARKPAELADLVERHSDNVRAVALDVTDVNAAKGAVRVAVEGFGRLDVLVNNAGYADAGSIEDTDDAVFRAQIETNLFGVINVTKAAIPVMREQGSGHIIQISSIGGRTTAPGIAPYQTAKWAVEGFSGVLAKEVGPLGIKVTIVEPGGFRTDWAGSSMTIRESRPEYDSTIGAMIRFRATMAGQAPGDPAKAAQAILKIAGVDEPPLRLLLGSDAVRLADLDNQARIETDRKWRELSLSTDFAAPNGPPSLPWEKR
jgi:NAD(P)-dependent dehydrogenase (short-subunit alcohol dehydrogenase family)